MKAGLGAGWGLAPPGGRGRDWGPLHPPAELELPLPGLPELMGPPSPPAGGAPDVAVLTGGRFSSGVTGCIKNLVLHSSRPGGPPAQPVDLQHRAQAGANTRPCPS